MVRTPVRLALPLLFILIAAPALQAQDVPVQQQQREHVVRRGDTLWDLARAYLQNPFLWPLIYEANRNVVDDPHWIYPAERLIIPPRQPEQPERPAEPLGDPPAIISVGEDPPVEAADTTPTPVVPEPAPRPVVPLEEYLGSPWLSEGAAAPAARIADLADPADGPQRLPSMVHPNDLVRVSGATAQPGDSLLVVRTGRSVNGWGNVVEPLGVLRVESVAGGVVLARMVQQFGGARVGDRVMPIGTMPEIGTASPEPVANGPVGHLLEFLDEEPLHGTTDLAFINVGRAGGAGIGDEFAVYVPASGEPAHVATVRVVRVGDGTATVRVLDVNSLALRDGLPIRLVRKMP